MIPIIGTTDSAKSAASSNTPSYDHVLDFGGTVGSGTVTDTASSPIGSWTTSINGPTGGIDSLSIVPGKQSFRCVPGNRQFFYNSTDLNHKSRDFRIDLWFRPKVARGVNQILCATYNYSTGDVTGSFICFLDTAMKVNLIRGDNAPTPVVGASAVLVDTNYKLTLVYQHSVSKMQVLINGSNLGILDAAIATSQGLQFGGSTSNFIDSWLFDGYFAEIRSTLDPQVVL